MKNLVRVLTVLKICIIISLFAGIAFATSPAPSSSSPSSSGEGSGPQAQIIKTCGTETNMQNVFYIIVEISFIAVLIYVLTGKKPQELENKPDPLKGILITDPYKSDPDQYAYSNPGPKAEVREPSGAFKSIPLQTGSNSIGRDPSNRIPLDDPKASRNHADLNVSPEGKYVLTDLGSQNGTTVNGEKISQQEIFGGDQIGIGDSSITI